VVAQQRLWATPLDGSSHMRSIAEVA
jgi:hypothetical protein